MNFHYINNELCAIIGYAELLLLDEKNPNSIQKLEAIIKHVKNIIESEHNNSNHKDLDGVS